MQDIIDYINDWQLWETIGEYRVWCRGTAGHESPAYSTLWNVTQNDFPPTTLSGYYSKEEILKLKGLI